MANPILSQIEIGGVTYDLRDMHAQGAMHFIGKTESTEVKEGVNYENIEFDTTDGNTFYFGRIFALSGDTSAKTELKQGDVVFVGKKEFAVVVNPAVGDGFEILKRATVAFVEFGSIGGKVEGVPTTGHTHTYKKSSLTHGEHAHDMNIEFTPEGMVSNGTPTKGDFVTGVTETRGILNAKKITPVGGTGKAITELNTTSVPNVTSVGTATTTKDETVYIASVTGTKLVLSAKTIKAVDNAGTAPTLGTAISVATSAKTTADFAKAGADTWVADGTIVHDDYDGLEERRQDEGLDELDVSVVNQFSAPTGKAITAESEKTFTGTKGYVEGMTDDTTLPDHTETDTQTGAPSATGDFAVVG